MAPRQAAPKSRVGSFDAFDLALRNASLSGTIDPASLPRVADLLDSPTDGSTEVAWHIRGSADALGHPMLEIRLDGVVPLVCQRCLASFTLPIAQSTQVLLARDASELARLDDADEREVVLAATPLDAPALVEDEIVLALPYVPRCSRAECAETAMSGARSDDAAPASAFAALADAKVSKKPRN